MKTKFTKKFKFNMVRKATQLISILIPILTLCYGVGDYSGWWDKIFGRTNATLGWERLASNEGFPKIIVFNDDPVFNDHYEVIKANSKNKDALTGIRQNLKPTAIIRVGGTLKPDAGENLPEGWPNPKFAPESLPVVFLYDFTKDSFLKVKSFHSKSLTPVGTLGDVRRWIEDSRNQERFIFSTIILGILSIVIILLDWTRSGEGK